jgi:hypothetical protein
MTVIKICDYFLKTNLNGYDAKEMIEAKIIDCVVENGDDFPFSLEDFLEEFVEINDKFEMIEDSHDWNIEFTPEDVDEMVEQASSGDENDDEESEDLFEEELDDEE